MPINDLDRPGPAIHASGLRKSYGDLTVLDGVDLTVPTGSVMALLGPNGAGKSTTIGILTTLLAADSGTATVAGHDVRTDGYAVRSAIGVTGQISAVDRLLTGAENMRLMADLHRLSKAEGRARAAELLDRFGLTDDASRKVATYSGGMQRKLDLAMTLMGRPEVVFLDEPTAGLDPRSRRALWDAVRALTVDGVTVLLTTQYLEEADQLADRVALLHDGRIVAEGTPTQLKRRVPGGAVRLHLRDDRTLHAARTAIGAGTADADALTLTVPDADDVRALRRLLDALDDADVPVDQVELLAPDLDDVFLTLTASPSTHSAA